jgi:hypothetical protein
VLHSKFDRFLNVLCRSGIDADDWYTALLAWNTERSVEVASFNRPVGKGVGLPLGVFGSPRLIRTPDAVEPPSLDFRAVS